MRLMLNGLSWMFEMVIGLNLNCLVMFSVESRVVVGVVKLVLVVLLKLMWIVGMGMFGMVKL